MNPFQSSGRSQRPALQAEIGFAIIGAGAISGQHAEAIARTPGTRLVAICSARAESARAAGERLQVPWSTDLRATLSRPDVDVAVICTPSGYHAPHAMQALRLGKHVLIEKPIAMSLTEADEVITLARQLGKIVSTVSQHRFHPVIRQVREAVHRGLLGRIALAEGATRFLRPQTYYDSANWRGTIDLDGGALMNQGIHVVDLVRWIMGPVESISGHVRTIAQRIESEDTATASIQFASGALGTIVATTIAYPGFTQDIRIHGDRGYVHLVDFEPIGWEVPGVSPPQIIEPTSDDRRSPTGRQAWAYAAQYADFTQAVLEGRPPAVSGEDGRAALEVVLAVYASAKRGQSIRLESGGAGPSPADESRLHAKP